MKKIIALTCVVGLGVILSSCAAQVSMPVAASSPEPGGFWWGLWNGFTAVFSLIGHLFNTDIAIYDKNNNGGWYDFGFLIGVGAFSGAAGRNA